MGITVWTNFTFASQAFCADPEFLDPAIRECVYIIKKRRNHPSNIFWMGGEEVFFSDAHVASDNKHIMELLGEAVRQVRTTPFGLALLLRGHFGQSWVQTERVRAGQRALLWGRAGVHRGVLHQESLENRDKYGKGYYRYFPILWDLA